MSYHENNKTHIATYGTKEKDNYQFQAWGTFMQQQKKTLHQALPYLLLISKY